MVRTIFFSRFSADFWYYGFPENLKHAKNLHARSFNFTTKWRPLDPGLKFFVLIFLNSHSCRRKTTAFFWKIIHSVLQALSGIFSTQPQVTFLLLLWPKCYTVCDKLWWNNVLPYTIHTVNSLYHLCFDTEYSMIYHY